MFIRSKILLLVATINCVLYFSQTNRFIYELQYRNSSDEGYRKTLMNLDISSKMVKFYDKTFADYDSINKNAGTVLSKYSTKTDQIVTRELNSSKNNWYREFFDYFVVETDDEFKWNLLPDNQTYNGYQLQKATTDFGGRTWTAWFSKDVDIKEGPYKFRGLPGLIFILEDSEKDFMYKLIKNEKLSENYDTSGFLETLFGKKAVKISNKKFNSYIEDIYLNPTRMLSENIKNGGKANIKDENIETIEQLNSKKPMLQKGIKSRYIFIEKDKQPVFK